MKPRILFVDDDDDMLLLLQRAARRADFFSGVMAAGGTPEALALLATLAEDARPHLILTDLKMPGLDGEALIRQLKAMPEIRHLPVAVLTSSDLPDDEARCRNAGACGYYLKPSSLGALDQVLRSAIASAGLPPPASPSALPAK